MTRWYHRTCAHSAADLAVGDYELDPKYNRILGTKILWFSYDPNATARALGLASHILVTCDRMEYRFEVVEEDRRKIVPWSAVSRQFQMGQYLDATKGARPTLWGVAFEPVRLVTP